MLFLDDLAGVGGLDGLAGGGGRDCGCGSVCGSCSANFGLGLLQPLADRQPILGEGPNFGAVRDDCPEALLPLELPDFMSVDVATMICFFGEGYGLQWPQTDCCPPDMAKRPDCVAPTYQEAWDAHWLIPNMQNRYADEIPDAAQEPTPLDQLLFGAALRMLLDNLDIARWATCLVQSWSPELGRFALLDCVTGLLTADSTGIFPLTVTYVDVPVTGNTSATMWAFTRLEPASDGSVGLIIPIGSTTWTDQVAAYVGGGDDGTCAAIQVAGTILHELIHVCADGVVNPHYVNPFPWTGEAGALHEDRTVKSPCWDESRMVATIFFWAMARRYGCVRAVGTIGSPAYSETECSKYAEVERFAHSSRGW